MGIDSGNKNPWGKGDARQKELGDDDVKKIRDEVRSRHSIYRSGQGVEGTVTKQFSDGLRDMGGDVDRMARKQFVTSLTAAGGRFAYTFELTESGLIPRLYFASEKSEQAMLAICAIPMGKNPDGVVIGWHPNDLMTAAKQISEEYPEVKFTFDPQPKTFSYTATIDTAKRVPDVA